MLRPRSGSVIAETIGDETLVIDTEAGCFYSLRGVGAACWVLLERGATASDLDSAIAARDPGVDGVDRAVNAFLAVLEGDGVLTVAAPDATEVAPAVDVPWPADYVEPIVDKHDDVAALLLIDPLHDVDDTGWPNRAP